jgi:RimK family alpha-L-glutamate ligase
MTPQRALEVLRPGDAALGRLDVLPTLDGMDDGLWALGALAARGVHVLNDPAALLAAHDKLLTSRLLRRYDIAHPATLHVRNGRATSRLSRPVVLKPRYGSWGREVHRCDDPSALAEALARVRHRGWYLRHGAIVQELIPPQGYDLRILVAAGRVVGAVYRLAAAGEWRTNVALGGVRRPVLEPPPKAAALAVAAARSIGTALVGVDLLPTALGGWVVAELNGAVEFSSDYAPYGDVFAETALALTREVQARVELRVHFALPAAA